MRKHKLSDDHIFKPTGRKMTPEEEKKFEIFLDILDQKGTASVSDPLGSKPDKPLSEALKDGSSIVTFNDSKGKMSFLDFYKRALNGDYDEK